MDLVQTLEEIHQTEMATQGLLVIELQDLGLRWVRVLE